MNGKKVSVQMSLNESGHAVFVQPQKGSSSHIDVRKLAIAKVCTHTNVYEHFFAKKRET